MELSFENISPVKRKLSATIPVADVNAALNKALQHYRNQVAMPGFRKGKAPVQAVEKRFGAEIVGSATENLINRAIEEALRKEGQTPLDRGQLDGGQAARDADYSFSFTFEVLPQMELPAKLEDLSVEERDSAPTEKEVEALTRRMLHSMATLTEVTENRLPQTDDVVLVDVDGTYEGKPVPGMKAENFLMQISAPHEEGKEGEAEDAAPEVEAIVRSLHVGEESSGKIVCPEAFPDPAMRGKEIDMQVKLHKIHTETLPELDDPLAQKNGFDNVDQLKHFIMEQARRNNMAENRAAAQKKLLDGVLDKLDYPLPDCLLEKNRLAFKNETQHSLSRQGMDDAAIETTLENMKAEMEVQARAQAKAQAFLLALAARDRIAVTNQELERHLHKMAKDSGQDVRKMYENLLRAGLVEEIRGRLLVGKTLDYLYMRAAKTIVDAEGNPVPQEKPLQEITPNPFPAEEN